MKEVVEGLFEIKNFLSKEDLSTVIEAVDINRYSFLKKSVSSGDLVHSLKRLEIERRPFAKIVQRTAEKKVEGIHGEAKNFLVRYDGKRSTLHHDLNGKPFRTWTIILYLKPPDSGGELVFPFYNGDGDFTSNEISKTCLELASKNNRYYCANTEYRDLMTNNTEDYLHFKPTVNTAYVHNTLNPNLWHYVSPNRGERISLIAFWEKERR